MLYGGDVILHGGTPYVDAALNKGPLTYVLFAALRPVVGRSEVAVRLSLLAFAILAALAITQYLRRAADSRTALVGGLAFAMFSGLAAFEGADPNLEQYAILPMALALWMASGRSATTAALTGALTAAVGLLSPDLLIPLGPAVMITLWPRHPPRLGPYAAAVAGAAVLLTGVGAWLLAAGALPDLLNQVPGTSGAPAGQHWLAPSHLLDVPALGLWLVALLGAGVALTRPGLRRPAAVALLWILLVWARVKVGDHLTNDPEYPQHYYAALLGIALALALGLAATWQLAHEGRALRPRVLRRRWLYELLVILALALAYVAIPERDALRVPVALRNLDYPWGDAYPLAAYVDRHTAPSARIYVTGSQPEVYWLADRFSPTRFFDIYPVFAHPAYEAERMRALRLHPPAAIVAMPGYGPEPDLAQLMRRLRYRRVFASAAGEVWQRSR
jgi:hypothetical protein